MAAQQFVERQCLVGRAAQEEAQAIDAELLNVASGDRHFSVMRSTPAAPDAAGFGGATIGRPERRTFSTSIGQSVTALVER